MRRVGRAQLRAFHWHSARKGCVKTWGLFLSIRKTCRSTHGNLAQEKVASCFQTFPKGSHFLPCPNTTFIHLNRLQEVESQGEMTLVSRPISSSPDLQKGLCTLQICWPWAQLVTSHYLFSIYNNKVLSGLVGKASHVSVRAWVQIPRV